MNRYVIKIITGKGRDFGFENISYKVIQMEFCDISQHMGCTDVIYFYWSLKKQGNSFCIGSPV